MKRPDPLGLKDFPAFKQDALVSLGRSRRRDLVPLFCFSLVLGFVVVNILAALYWLATLTPWIG